MSNLKDAWIELKNHVVRNKERYIVGAAVVTGVIITVVIMKKNQNLRCGFSSVLRCGAEGLGGDVGNTTRSSYNFSQSISIGKARDTTVTYAPIFSAYSGKRGSSGFITRCLETGEVFKTQSAAAEAFGISPSALSSHLNKGLDLTQGLHFERWGVPS